jgi:hypothetical protein
MSHAHDHSNVAPHDHPPAHEHPVEDYSARKHPEFVVLEIGGNLGALIVHTGADMHGVEIEISPEHDHQSRSHKQVLERSINGRAAFTAVFDGLAAGSYALWDRGEARARARDVTIEGGLVTQLDWRTPDGSASERAPLQATTPSRAPRHAAAPGEV